MKWVLKDKSVSAYVCNIEFEALGPTEDLTPFQVRAFKFSTLTAAKIAKNALNSNLDYEEFKIFRLTGQKKKKKKSKALTCSCKWMETYVLQLQSGLYLESCSVSGDGLADDVTDKVEYALKFTQPKIDNVAKYFAEEVAKALNTKDDYFEDRPFKAVKLSTQCTCNKPGTY